MVASESGHYGEEELAQAALKALQATSGLTGRLIQPPMAVATDRYSPDVAVAITVGSKSAFFYGECNTHIDRPSALSAIKAGFEELDAPGLLITSYLTPTLIETCHEIGLQYIDTAGNAYLDVPGLYILIEGRKASNTFRAVPREHLLDSLSALRMIFAILVKPELVHTPYREIAAVAGIALGSVGAVFRDLQQQGLVTGSDGRCILEPNHLLDVWVTTYPIRLRPTLQARRFRAPNPDWWRDLDPIELDAWWGGEIAADRLTGLLKPATQTLYVAPESTQQTIRTLAAKHRLRPDPTGDLEVLDAFWNMPRGATQPQVAPPALVYADLMASLSPRSSEVAKAIRDLAFADL